MKKTLIALGIMTTMLIGAQTSFAACPCEKPCPCAPEIGSYAQTPCCPAAPCCPVVTPCCPAAPVACPCTTVVARDNSNKCECKWYKIFQNKCCCDKPTKCECGFTAKRCHWFKFWEDRCIVKNSIKCDDKCDKCCD